MLKVGGRWRVLKPPHALRLVSIRYIIVVKLIKPVIANPAVWQRKEGLRPCDDESWELLMAVGSDSPYGLTGPKSDFGPIGSISRSIADTRNIIVVKLIKPVIAHPAAGQRKEGLRPLSYLYNKKIISNTCCRMQKKRHLAKTDFWPCPEGDRPGRWRIFARCLLHVFKTMY